MAWSALADAFFVVRSVAASGILFEDDVRTLRTHLAPLIHRHPDANVRVTALRLLAARCPEEDETQAALLRGLADSSSNVRVTALRTLAALRPSDARTHAAAQSALTDPRPNVRAEAVRLLATYWPAESSTFTALLRACRDREEDVRETAVRAVIVGFAPNPQIAGVLCRATADMSPSIKEMASAAVRCLSAELHAAGEEGLPPAVPRRRDRYAVLAPGATADPTTIIDLCDDQDWDVRHDAIYELAHRWPLDPDTRTVLVRATNDPEQFTRWRAYHEAVQYAPGTPGSRRLAEAETRDPSGFLRGEGLSLLALWEWDERTRDLVRKLTSDRVARVRAEATRLLAVKHPDDPANDPAAAPGACSSWSYLDELPVDLAIRTWRDRPSGRDDLIAADAAGDVSAAVLLAARWADDPAVAEILRRHQDSEHHVVRLTALHGLARCWPDDATTGRLLTAGADDPCAGVRSVALHALSQIADAAAQERVCAAMKDSDDVVASEAVDFAVSAGDAEAEPAKLLDLLPAAPGIMTAIAVADAVSSGIHRGEAGGDAVLRRMRAIPHEDARTRRWVENMLAERP